MYTCSEYSQVFWFVPVFFFSLSESELMDTAYDVIKELEPYKFVKQNSR